MQAAKWITFITALVLVNGQDEFPTNPDTQNYQYHYFVRDENTGDVKSHEEKKLGDTVNGQYTVGEPNGDLRVVTYTADEGGFRANVKYEEGGSPISDKSSQTNAKSGVDFQWIPGNPDDIGEQTEKIATEDENKQEPEGTSTEATTESNSETEETSEKNSSEEKAASEAEGKNPVDEEVESSSSESKPEVDSADKESEPKDGDNDDDKSISKESSEEKSTKEPESGEKEESEGKEESAEAAESAPESEEVAATEPSQMYLPLPVLPYPNMPFLTMPTENPQRENDRPTIIYASQNFYNPWQWFSTKRIVREEQPPLDDEQAGHYMTGLGYIIVPRQQQ